MLALKVAVEDASAKVARAVLPRTLVFDEIDIGIGGRAAEAVGKKLKALSRGQQVICITHLRRSRRSEINTSLLRRRSSRGGRRPRFV